MKTYNIAVCVGSLRQASLNKKVAHALIAMAPQSLELHVVDISQLALYNEDLDQSPPPEWAAFRKEIRESDGILFVTPEYNRSIPSVLKNAIDVGSRPYGQSTWDGKPAAIVSVSPSSIGGFGANHHLRQALVFLNMPAMQQPEAYIGNAGELFDRNDQLVKESTRKFLNGFIDAFAAWVAKNLPD
ncbi:NADPH-dependent FMN reductase [Parapedobacter lycopersici]|uniref:NADPH-dependent FMN reductase n=1 Tax=Parapedobacter lycopersici TaxID=1864939 RepID=UPI00214DDB90|nr:NAD(P)H-dependent oxidoreductase [Parapedobacter lycopersici]